MTNATQPTDEVARRVLDDLERHVNQGVPLTTEARQYLARMQERNREESSQQAEFLPETRVEPGDRVAYDPVNKTWIGIDEARGRDMTVGVVIGYSDAGQAQVQFSTETNQMARSNPQALLDRTQDMLRQMQLRNNRLLRGTQQQRGNLSAIEESQAKKQKKQKTAVVATGGTRRVLRKKRKP